MLHEVLHSITLWGLAAIFITVVIGSIFLLRWIMDSSGAKIVGQASQGANIDTKKAYDAIEKKHWSVDINKYKGVIVNIGIIVSLALMLVAFEYPDYEEASLVVLDSGPIQIEEQIEIPQTQQKPPPPPKIQLPTIVEVPDEEEIEDEIEVELDVEIDQETVIEEVVEVEEEKEEEDVDQIFTIVEETAAPTGGMTAFYEYIKDNLEYPRQARRMGVQGKVFLEFIVDKDGSITDVKVVRGIGAGCDEEAIRILQNSPKWKPAKQRGRPVRQKMTFPINFKLN